VHCIGDLVDALFEEAERVRIRHHADRGVRAEHPADLRWVDASARIAAQRDDFEPHIAAEAGFRTVRGVGNDDFVALDLGRRSRKYFFAMSSAASSACAPAAGLSENAAMPKSEQRLRSSSCMTCSAPCASSSGANGCSSAKPWQIRKRVVDPRIVLHRARAQRIEAHVDAERPL